MARSRHGRATDDGTRPPDGVHVSAPAPLRLRFGFDGAIAPLVEPMAKAVGGTVWRPTRPLGGWVATYGQLQADGSVRETQDRQGHVFEAARTVGQIDFDPYLKRGLWNDTHSPVVVGKPTSLEHHDGRTELSKAHRKVGWWTEGHLWDRSDPRSWTLFGDYEPTTTDLDRADHFWRLATMLKGVPRPLGFSAEGDMLLSPCRRRIIWAEVRKNAVCELPQNPDAVAVPLRLATDHRLDLGMLGASPCDTCTCPPGARCSTRPTLAEAQRLAKAEQAAGDKMPAHVEPEPEGDDDLDEDMIDHLIRTYGVGREVAARYVRDFAAQQRAEQETR